jgi:hypothetical protein
MFNRLRGRLRAIPGGDRERITDGLAAVSPADNPSEFRAPDASTTMPQFGPRRHTISGMRRRSIYTDLKEFGLVFVTPQDVEFSDLVQGFKEYREVHNNFPDAPTAVLLNNSGKAIIALARAFKPEFLSWTVLGA